MKDLGRESWNQSLQRHEAICIESYMATLNSWCLIILTKLNCSSFTEDKVFLSISNYMKTDLQSWCWRKLRKHSNNACWTTVCRIIPSTVTEMVRDVKHKAGCPWDSWTLLRKEQCHSLSTLKATMLLLELKTLPWISFLCFIKQKRIKGGGGGGVRARICLAVWSPWPGSFLDFACPITYMSYMEKGLAMLGTVLWCGLCAILALEDLIRRLPFAVGQAQWELALQPSALFLHR